MKFPPGGVPVYILAGGRSSRFGTDKARALAEGEPLLTTVAERVRPYASSVAVVAARAGQYRDLGLRTLGDLRPGLGPMGGLATALADMDRPGWLALIACDWAGLRGEWLVSLKHAARPGDCCVLYAPDAGKPEPLFALYHHAIAPAVREHLDRDERAMRTLIDAVPHRVLAVPPGWEQARNINRVDDIEAFRAPKGTPHA